MQPTLKRKLQLRQAALSVRANYGDAKAQAELNKIESAFRIAAESAKTLEDVCAMLNVDMKGL